MATETVSKLALQRQLNVSPAKLEGAIRALSINSGINQFTKDQAEAIARYLQGQPSQGNTHSAQMTPPPSIDGGALMSLDMELVQEAANQGAALADRQMQAMAHGYLQRKSHLTEVLFGHIKASSRDFTGAVQAPAPSKSGSGYSDPFAGYFISAAEMPQISGS